MEIDPTIPQPEESAPFEAPKEENTITFRRSHLYAALLPLAFVLGLSVGYLFWGRTPAIPANTPQAGAPQAVVRTPDATAVAEATQEKPTRYNVPVDDDPALGPADAPITLIEFSDYECPYCRKWHDEVFHKLVEHYQDKLRFVYRDFPLEGLHSNAEPAAEAAQCAGDQGKYWEYHDLLFGMTQSLSASGYKQYATDLGLNATQFDDCLTSRKFQQEVQADYEYATNLGIRQTPTFFINGLAVVGAQPLEVFEQIIDQELAGKIPK